MRQITIQEAKEHNLIISITKEQEESKCVYCLNLLWIKTDWGTYISFSYDGLECHCCTLYGRE